MAAKVCAGWNNPAPGRSLFYMKQRTRLGLALVVILAAGPRLLWAVVAPGAGGEPAPAPALGEFQQLVQTLSPDPGQASAACAWLGEHWQPAFVAPLLELLPWAGEQEQAAGIARLINAQTGVDPLTRDDAAWQWLWRAEVVQRPAYASFKAALYSRIDPRFREYFAPDRPASIRLDEIRWGGVARDGIPPLRRPKMLRAADAGYLADTNIVFGIERNGDARAYPKRILAWHEMATDTVGGEDLCLVYCTLCGTVIPYRATARGVHHELGTSGFLYRSNKLMYDAATKSLWNTLTGEPVVGPLVGQGIRLEALPVVTTTWGEWRRRHPQTTVLSLETGHQRDYGEGRAYARYFATDELMFTVPETDPALKNKAEILAVRLPGGAPARTVFAADFLAAHPVHQAELGGRRLVILTDGSGANRAYAGGDREFTRWENPQSVRDAAGGLWTVTEDALRAADGTELARVPAHRAFWFGWRAAYPDTVLVK